MNILIGILYVVEVVSCLLLALVVMMQKPKEGGLGGMLGGGMAEAAFGADAGNILVKATATLGIVFLLNTMLLARFTSQAHSKSVMAGVDVKAAEPAAQQQLPAPAPVPAPAPAPAPSAPAEAK